MLTLLHALVLALPLAAASPPAALEADLRRDLPTAVHRLLARAPGKSAAFVLDKGEHALRIRGWLAGRARQSLDVQYFIWSDDNVGRLAHEAMLSAAERGVRCRVLVDDLLLTAPSEQLLALDAHPNIAIKVYNPNTTVGVGFWRRWKNVLTDFRGVNQRMHHKAFLVDELVGICGGRNISGEYFDFDHTFNFRDRELLVAGPVVAPMQAAFEQFWASPLSRPVAELLPEAAAQLSAERIARLQADLHAYAADPANFAPEVREGIAAVPARAADLLAGMDLCRAQYFSDAPGKNDGTQGLGGGGQATAQLAGLLAGAKEEVLIQSPYLILGDDALALFKALLARGVKVRISTNSAANNDNLQAISGYQRQRARLLAAGLRIYEHKPLPANMRTLLQRYGRLEKDAPIFVMHAKTLVVDRRRLFVGTFNLDPRSMHLNTEAGILVESPKLAAEVAAAIEDDMAPANSWDTAVANGDQEAPRGRRLKLWFWRRLPLDPIL